MGGWRWVFASLLCALVLLFGGPARADDGFATIHVCARPSIVPEGVAAWVFTANADSVVLTIPRADFKKHAGGLTVYVYDPFAPPESVKLLPKKFTSLVCPPPPAPVKPPEAPAPKKDPPKAEDKKPVGGDTVTANPKKKDADKKDAKKSDKDEEEPPDLPKPLTHPPPPEWHPQPPKGGRGGAQSDDCDAGPRNDECDEQASLVGSVSTSLSAPSALAEGHRGLLLIPSRSTLIPGATS